MDPESTYYLSAPLDCDDRPVRGQAVARRDVRPHVQGQHVGGECDAQLRQHRVRAPDARRRRREGGGDGAQRSASARGSTCNGAYVPSIGLGSIAVTPLDMASAYATLRRGRRLLEADGDHEGDPPARGRWTRRPAGASSPAQARDLRRRRVRGDEDPRGERAVTAPASARTSAGPRPGRRERPRITPTRGSRGYTPQLEASVWVGYQRAEIPMDDVHGISVAGGTFPATIWNLFMSKALERQDADRTSRSRTGPRRSTTGTGSGSAAGGSSDQTTTGYSYTPDDDVLPADELGPVASALAAGVAVLGAHDGCRPARVAGRIAARAAERRPSGRRLAPRLVLPRAAGRRVRRLRRRRRARARVAAASRRRRGARVRDPARAARRAAAALDRRMDVLGLRPHRGRARREPVRAAPSDVPRRSRVPVRRDGLARHDDRLRPGVHARVRAARARRRDVRRRGGVDLQDDRRGRRARVLRRWPPGSRAGRRSRCAFVGWNPLLAVHFAGGGHNDAWVALLVLGALAAAAAGRRQLAGVCWAVGALVKWVPLVLLPLRALEARATHRRVGHSASPSAALVVGAAAFVRYGTGWLHAFGPLARNANHETSWSLPHRLEQLGVPHGVAIAVFALAFARRVRVARARGVARPRAPRPRDVRAAARAAVPRRLVRRVGRAARRCGGRRAGGAALARHLRVPAAPDDPALARAAGRGGRRARRPARRRAATRGSSAATTTCAAVGSGASRSA